MNTSRFVTKFGVFVLPQNDKYIIPEFEKGGHWEEKIIDILIKVCREDFTVINVGAHVGSTIIPISDHVERVFCFEPQEKMYDLLLKNILTNGVSNIIPFRGVVSNTKKTKVSMKPTDHSGISVVDKVNGKVNYGGVSIGLGGEEVFSYKIDNLIIGNVDLITIDAEGSEELVVLSAQKTIELYRPILMIERNYLTVTEDMQKSLGTEDRLDIDKYLSELSYYQPINLGDSNFLYIPIKYHVAITGRSFLDQYNFKWYIDETFVFKYEEETPYLPSEESRNKLYYLTFDSMLVIFPNNYFSVGHIENNTILWDNKTKWQLLE